MTDKVWCSICIWFACKLLIFSFLNASFLNPLKASNVLSVSLDSLDELTERQLVVHFEVLPQVSNENDLLCGDVRVLESLVLPSDDGSTHFNNDPSANVNLSLPVSINMSELLNSSLEVIFRFILFRNNLFIIQNWKFNDQFNDAMVVGKYLND